MKHLKISLLSLLSPVLLLSYQNIHHWNSITSAINVHSVVEDQNGNLIGATSGGLLNINDSIRENL